jgi:magnesium-transporting ATPase (P-type)
LLLKYSNMEAKKNLKGDNTVNQKKRSLFEKGSMLFISLSLLVHAGFFILLFLHSYDPGFPQFTAIFSVYLVFALWNLVGIAGVILRRAFGKTLAEILIIFDFVMALRYPWLPISLILSIVSYILFRANAKTFRKPEKNDKYVYYGMIVALLIPIILLIFPSLVPKLHTDPADVTREAIENNDLKICDKILGGGDRRRCLSSFALETKNSTICELVDWEHDRDLCYLDVANSVKDPEICKLIKDSYERGMCYGNKET